ncbi:igE-binding protein-like [Rattus rattus]|uniref:igE-binding protein-like n=1 Tax=Rattus rattus TaxID=10117 RepID=UPI0013F2F231|nr:igE-binding protein-like [Rattus rattus]
MFGLDLFHFSPPLEDVAEAFVIVLAAFILSLLVFDFVAAARHHQRSCLEDGKCRPTVIAGQGVLGELQDSMTETERDKRLKSSKRKGTSKKTDSSKDFISEGARDWGKNAPGEKQRKEKKALKRRSLYPVKELEALELDSSETDELSSSEEEDLEDEAAHYEEEGYHPDEQ